MRFNRWPQAFLSNCVPPLTQPRSNSCASQARSLAMEKPPYVCEIDAEPIHRYQIGGYHPVHLGDVMHEGRYRVIHKLGWGGWSTVWAARDLKTERYVALQIAAADSVDETREMKILRSLQTSLPASPHLIQMLDNFQCEGPNGRHNCLVLELLGPSVANLVRDKCVGDRLPGRLAKRFARSALEGLAALHQEGIAHGDIHIGNLALSLPMLEFVNEEEFMLKMGKTEVSKIQRRDGREKGIHVPEYIVRPTTFPIKISEYSGTIKLVDFGESFRNDAPLSSLHTPLPVRAPEVIFGDDLTTSVDLWSAACMIYELVVGQPPFDTFMQTKPTLVGEMIGMASDKLPDRWQPLWQSMRTSAAHNDDDDISLETWLEESYFDGQRPVDLTKNEIVQFCKIVRRLLLFEPSSRASAAEIAQDPWFDAD
ncbi:serine protein kinase [Dissoconium aciculare CBS 342.82]|uniref:non-specific serine/threonine protein kinase n=1 Tax=Dissoconium aciculare CBS 342.82 TaxID=1314786 RepID=A0A6J3M316_9PEZI|nr:serine protein kinase [Dissoconium aciculare CBS 342.82]KAF1821332.1 serine protein kinase [Dissoconium aciculare CBS 342.82]